MTRKHLGDVRGFIVLYCVVFNSSFCPSVKRCVDVNVFLLKWPQFADAHLGCVCVFYISPVKVTDAHFEF